VDLVGRRLASDSTLRLIQPDQNATG